MVWCWLSLSDHIGQSTLKLLFVFVSLPLTVILSRRDVWTHPKSTMFLRCCLIELKQRGQFCRVDAPYRRSRSAAEKCAWAASPSSHWWLLVCWDPLPPAQSESGGCPGSRLSREVSPATCTQRPRPPAERSKGKQGGKVNDGWQSNCERKFLMALIYM